MLFLFIFVKAFWLNRRRMKYQAKNFNEINYFLVINALRSERGVDQNSLHMISHVGGPSGLKTHEKALLGFWTTPTIQRNNKFMAKIKFCHLNVHGRCKLGLSYKYSRPKLSNTNNIVFKKSRKTGTSKRRH